MPATKRSLPAMRLAQIASGDGAGVVAGTWAACGAEVVGCCARPGIPNVSRTARYAIVFFIMINLEARVGIEPTYKGFADRSFHIAKLLSHRTYRFFRGLAST